MLLGGRAFSETQPTRPELLGTGMGLGALLLQLASDEVVRRARQAVYHISAEQPGYFVQPDPPEGFGA